MSLLLLAGWLGSGAVVALVLGRRGFDAVSWMLIGTVLGPLSALIAWNCVRRDERLGVEVVSAAPTKDGVDVLAGFDGSPESHAAIVSVAALFGDRLGRLTIAAVVPFDEGRESDAAARAMLEREAQQLSALTPGLELVHGHPATALQAAAREGGFDLLAVGTTGQGRAHLFGSAAAELARESDVPVLLCGRPPSS